MKRLLLAAGLALTLHGLLLGAEPDWVRRNILRTPRARVVTMTLSYYQPQKTQLKPAEKRPDIQPKTITPVVKKKEIKHLSTEKPPKKQQIPKKIPKPQKSISKPQRLAKASSQPKKEVVPKAIHETIRPSKHETPPAPKQPEMMEEPFEPWSDFNKDIFEEKGHEENAHTASIRPAQAIHEARPIYLTNPPPAYPRLARKRGYEGTVVLEVWVDRSGRVKDLRVLTSCGHTMLDKVAVTTVKDWLFEPGMRGDDTVEMWVKIPIRFQLK